MTEWSEFHGKRKRNYDPRCPQPARPPEQPVEPVVVGRITYKPLTRYTITFEVQPDPKDVRIAELEALLHSARMIGQHTATLLLAAYERIDELEAMLAIAGNESEAQP